MKTVELKLLIDNKFNWIAQDEDASVTVFVEKPDLKDGVWDVKDGEYKILMYSNTGAYFDNGWKKSLLPLEKT
jgi:hypothetical protein